jgi:hypothetical protein
MKKLVLRLGVLLALSGIASQCMRGPSEDTSRIKSVKSLRLADGSTISRPETDEYNPHLMRMSDNHLVLVFGSNRACGLCSGHNIFVTRSLTPYNGAELPFFATPIALTESGSPLNQPFAIDFAVAKENADVSVALNTFPSNSVYVGGIDVMTGEINSYSPLPNMLYQYATVVGAKSTGDRIYVLDSGTSQAYEISPGESQSGTWLGPFFTGAPSIAQVRQENSGFSRGLLGTFGGFSVLAATPDQFVGPLSDLELALLSEGILITTINQFYDTSAAGDLTLFTGYDGGSDDMYVITSHTSRALWETAGFFGSDELPGGGMPMPMHVFDFESNYDDSGLAQFLLSLDSSTGMNFDASSYHPIAGEAALFGGTGVLSYSSITPINWGDAFTIAAWIMKTPGTGTRVIMSNADDQATGAGFKLYINGSDQNKLVLQTGNGGSQALAISDGNLIVDNLWHHVAVTVNRSTTTARLFIDGVHVNTSSMTTLGDFNTVVSGQLNIGANTTGTEVFAGKMDDIFVFNEIVGDVDIAMLAFMPP